MNVGLIDRLDILDKNATLSVVDSLPFSVRRIFYIHSALTEQERGNHAHRACHQIYVCVKGSVAVECTDGNQSIEYVLDEKSKCLYVPPMVWSKETGFDENTIFLVLCSEKYNDKDYLRSFDNFMEIKNEEKKESMG